MVRIVNGEIVPDDAPRPQTVQISSEAVRLFPSTYGKLGKLSESVTFYKYQSEIIWLLLLLLTGFLKGPIQMCILVFILWVYQRNYSVVESKNKKINTFRTLGTQ